MKINLKQIASDLVKNGSTLIKSVGKWGSKHAPGLCTGVGLFGMGATVYMVHKSSPKYYEKISEKEMTTGEKVEVAVKTYWPSMVSFAASGACIIAGNRISNKRYLALATSAALAQKELMTTQEGILETMGPEALKKVNQKVAEERNKNVDLNDEDIIETEDGEELFYEPLTGHYFKSSQNSIVAIENELNAWLLTDDRVGLSTWLIELGLRPCELSNALEWVTRGGYENSRIDVDFTPSKVKVKGKEVLCWNIVYKNLPIGEFPVCW